MTRHRYESMLRSAQYELILEEVRLAVGSRPLGSPEEQWAAVAACRAAACLQRWGEAVPWAERGLALRSGNPEASGWLHFILGTALLYIGDVFRCQRAFEAFSAAAAATPLLAGLVPDSLFNQGFLARMLGREAEAVRLFREAARAYAGCERHSQAVRSRIEVVWSYLTLADLPAAEAELEGLCPLMAADGDAELQTDLEIEQAYCHYLAGGAERCGEALADLWNRPDLLPRQKAEVAWLAGRTAFDSGDRTTARRWGDEAYRFATQDWFPEQIDRIDQFRKSLAACWPA